MVYQGSKNKLAKYIVPIIQEKINENNITTYIEPMCGSCSIIGKIDCENRIASDINDELIALLQYAQSDNKLSIAPDRCSFEHYADVRENRKLNTGKYTKEYTALIGYCASYGGRYFDGGYGRDSKGGRSIYYERLLNMKNSAKELNRIDLKCCDYTEYADYKNCLFYFDPPYRQKKQYVKQSMDYDYFYDFIRRLSKNNIVLISEFNMPDDFTCIWQKQRKVLQKSNRIVGENVTEKLFQMENNNIEATQNNMTLGEKIE